MILVDTNAWVNHLRKSDVRLVQFLTQQHVRICDVVIGELLLGTGLPSDFAKNLRLLPRLPSPSATDTRTFVERHPRVFAGSGVGWGDTQIMLAAFNAGACLHSLDKGVLRVSRELGLGIA